MRTGAGASSTRCTCSRRAPLRRARRRGRAQRPGRRHHPGAGRAQRAGAGGAPRGGRWQPVGGADPARLRPRRLLRRPSARPILPVFSEWPLAEHGLEWIEPPVALAHPLDDGSAALVRRDLDATAAGLGEDGERYRRLIGPIADDWDLMHASCWDRSASAPACAIRSPSAGTGCNALQPVDLAGATLPHPGGQGVAGGGGRALLRAPREAGHRRLRPVAAGQRACRRLADPARRLAADRRRAGRLPTLAGRRDRDRPRVRAWTSCRRPGRCCLTSRRASCWRSPATGWAACTPPAAPLPLRAGRLQGGLGAGRADPWANPALRGRARCTWAGRWPRSPPASGRGGGRHAEPALLLVAQPSLFDDSARRRAAHGLGLLPRAARLARGHDRADRGPDRALRARASATASWAARPWTGGAGTYNANYVGGDINGACRTCASS